MLGGDLLDQRDPIRVQQSVKDKLNFWQLDVAQPGRNVGATIRVIEVSRRSDHITRHIRLTIRTARKSNTESCGSNRKE